MRCAALRLACAVVDGLHPLDRNTAPVQAEAYTLLLRNAKVGTRPGQWPHG